MTYILEYRLACGAGALDKAPSLQVARLLATNAFTPGSAESVHVRGPDGTSIVLPQPEYAPLTRCEQMRNAGAGALILSFNASLSPLAQLTLQGGAGLWRQRLS